MTKIRHLILYKLKRNLYQTEIVLRKNRFPLQLRRLTVVMAVQNIAKRIFVNKKQTSKILDIKQVLSIFKN